MADNYESALLTFAPGGYYPLADAVGSATAFDVSPHVRTGTVHGTVTFGQASPFPGSVLTCAQFDGASGYISLPNTIPIDGLSALSVLVWFNFSAFNGNFDRILVCGDPGNSTANKGIDLQLDPATNRLFCILGNGATSCYFGYVSVALDQQYGLAVIFDGAMAKMYVIQNGQAGLVDSEPLSGTISAPPSVNWTIGSIPGGGYGFFPGTMGHVAIVPGTALNLEQIQWLARLSQGQDTVQTFYLPNSGYIPGVPGLFGGGQEVTIDTSEGKVLSRLWRGAPHT